MNATHTATSRHQAPRDAEDAVFDPAPDDDEPELADGDEALLEGHNAAGPARGKRAGSVAEPEEAQLALWIEHIVDHDERALTALYDATLSRVYGLVQRIVNRPSLAEEVVEDTYFQVWRQAARFDPSRGRALGWVLAMARSRAIDALRREARFAHDSLDSDSAPEVPDDGPGGDSLVEAARASTQLQQALLQLAAQPRQLVALAFLRGLSHEEIAVQTSLPLGTVKSQIRRALITLRQVLGDQGGTLVS